MTRKSVAEREREARANAKRGEQIARLQGKVEAFIVVTAMAQRKAAEAAWLSSKLLEELQAAQAELAAVEASL